MSEYWGIIATSLSGMTSVMELVSGREHAATKVAELLESDHNVRLFECTQVEYEISTSITIHVTKR